jgi:carbon storage regulator
MQPAGKETGMLVLSRKEGESIFVGDNIEIVVVKIVGGKVRLGIKAPDEIPIHRMEVYRYLVANGLPLVRKKPNGTFEEVDPDALAS